jgi:predicted N-acetyltransferase YhbS
MRIVTYDELTPEMERSRQLVNLATLGGIFGRARIADLRRRRALADYVGVFAVEGDEVLGHVFVEHIPYDFADGPETISGIATVGTRPDVGRSGIAGKLLREAHRRERDDGRRFAALWTNRSWGAHILYEKIGYRDVYSSPWALHLPRVRRPKAPNVRPGKHSELAAIERFHDDMAARRVGYCRRLRGSLRAMARFRYVDPATELLVCRHDGELTGYADLERTTRAVFCGELVADSPAAKAELVAGVARAASNLPYAFQHTVVSDSPDLFRTPEFVLGTASWYGMMAADLGGEWTREAAVEQFGTQDPRFLCLSGDRF